MVDVWGRPFTDDIGASETFFVRLEGRPGPADRLVVYAARPSGCAPWVLIGSRTHGGPEEFTPLLHGARAVQQDSYSFRLEALAAAPGPSLTSGPRAPGMARGA